MGLSAVGLHGGTRRGTPRIGAVRRLTVPLQAVSGRARRGFARSRDTGAARAAAIQGGRHGADAVAVLTLAPEDVGAAGATIARAFHDDALTAHLYPDERDRARLT